MITFRTYHLTDIQLRKINNSKILNKKRSLWILDPSCFYCKKILTFDEATVDHYYPKSKGGGNGFDNLRLSCSPCNQDKADKILIKTHDWNN